MTSRNDGRAVGAQMRSTARAEIVGYEDLDSLMWEWFTVARSKSIPVSG